MADCANCGTAQPDGARFCSKCGKPIQGAPPPGEGEDWAAPPPPEKKSNATTIVIVCVCAFVGLCLFVPIIAAIAIPNLLAAKVSSNETAAIATLRNLASCQAQIQTSGKIDADEDGIGEYGTFLELTGSVGVKNGFFPAEGADLAAGDFGEQGSRVNPPIMSQALANVDPGGIVTKSGYCFVIYLPDSSKQGGWVHETGPAGSVGLAGGTGRVGVDAAEVRWCAYAWPVARGNSGNRCFFVNQDGDVLQSANDNAKHSGPMAPPPPESAFPQGKAAPVPGQPGRDGDVWKVTN